MNQDEAKSLDLTEVGQKLVGHSKSAEFSATRGLVVGLFPFIFEASERMSARAIGRFLVKDQNIKISQVTITRALNDPKKSWLLYFKKIEPEAVMMAKWAKSKSFKFLFMSQGDFDSRMNFEKEGIIGGMLVRGVVALRRPDRAGAIKVLREKWFSISLATRLKAQPYLEEHLMSLEKNL